jgi:hypothetical protein
MKISLICLNLVRFQLSHQNYGLMGDCARINLSTQDVAFGTLVYSLIFVFDLQLAEYGPKEFI